MFYLHLLVKLLSSNKKYWRAAKNLVPVLKGAIQVTFYYMKSFENPNERRKIKFSKNVENSILKKF